LTASLRRDNGIEILTVNSQGGRLPIRPGYLTQSRGGKPVAPLLGDYTEYDGGITSFAHLPLIWYVVANDYAFLTRFTPMTPLTTELELTWLVRDDAIERTDYDPDEVCWMWRETAAQDKTICENNQRGILSSRFKRCIHFLSPPSDFFPVPRARRLRMNSLASSHHAIRASTARIPN
jgi:phenylpropionate dioxygenase-like ring-hydroxylating dioxygenase large terminal subunit